MKGKQFLVIGLGRFGSALAKELYEMGHEVLGVDEDEENVKLMDEFLTHGIVGNVTNESFFSSIGVQNFDAAIIAIGSTTRRASWQFRRPKNTKSNASLQRRAISIT